MTFSAIPQSGKLQSWKRSLVFMCFCELVAAAGGNPRRKFRNSDQTNRSILSSKNQSNLFFSDELYFSFEKMVLLFVKLNLLKSDFRLFLLDLFRWSSSALLRVPAPIHPTFTTVFAFFPPCTLLKVTANHRDLHGFFLFVFTDLDLQKKK